MSDAAKASIVIRCKNEERMIGAVLEQVFAQQLYAPYEVVVLDSGSQDQTLSIVRQFPVRLETITPQQFTFGFALNHGAQLARGQYVVFLSAHCLPRDRTWLRDLLQPLETEPMVAATYGRQEPFKGVNPFEELELERSFALTNGTPARAHFSNANSALRRELVLQHPFDEVVEGGEDFLWAYLLPSPYMVQYVDSASVFHSHPPSLQYWRQRAYVEGLLILYLDQVHGVENPWATEDRYSTRFKWHVVRRIREDLHLLWRRGDFRALLRYPLYEATRVYFYKKGKRDGLRRYALGKSYVVHGRTVLP
jgi:glycosyltransferase involved in cell wall biosynthesis